MIGIKIENLSKSYTPGKLILEPLDLEIAPGELFFLLGPSGCGKSTLLRLIAGFIQPNTGSIYFNGEDVTGLPPEARNAPMVFQNYALWPHLSVYENVAFGLKAKKMAKNDVRKQVMEALEVVRMTEFADRPTPALSGGQQQRVALARALAVAPGLILLDEPLSNLDAKLRDEMRDELRTICRERNLTAIYVTHDRREALSMADRMALLHNGRIAQLGAPAELYRQPVNKFAASFLGECNFIPGKVIEDELVLTDLGTFAGLPVKERKIGTPVELVVRPEVIKIAPGDGDWSCKWQGTITGGSYLGEFASWKFDNITVNEIAPDLRSPGESCMLAVRPQDVVVLDKEAGDVQ